MCLGSCKDNVVTQLAAGIAGYSVATVKTPEALGAAMDDLACRGCIVDASGAKHAGSAAVHHPPIVANDVGGVEVPCAIPFAELTGAAGSGDEEVLLVPFEQEHAAFAYYNTTNPTSLAALVAQGQATAAELALSSDDRVCLPITLNHSMGFGFGVLAALSAGASIVLPAPAPDAAATVAAVRDEDCTILFADSHTLKHLPSESVPADQPSLRGGIIKIGSGEAFGLDTPRVWAGVELTTVGKPASASAAGHGHSHSSK